MRKLTVIRKGNLIGAAVAMAIKLDDAWLGEVKNGKQAFFEIDEDKHMLQGTMLHGSNFSGKTEIPAGTGDVTYEAKLKTGVMHNQVILTRIGD